MRLRSFAFSALAALGLVLSGYAARANLPPSSILIWDGTTCFNSEFSACLASLGVDRLFLSISDVTHTATGSYDKNGDAIMRHRQRTFDAHGPK